jgi:hypothetical protein
VRALAEVAAAARAAGHSEEAIARRLSAARNALKARYRELGSAEAALRAQQWSLARHGDPFGPTADQLHAGGKSWQEIIAAACRPGREPPQT